MPVSQSYTVQTDASGVPFIALKQCRVRLLEPGIVESCVNEGAAIDVEDIWEIRRANEFFCPGRKYAILVAPDNFNSITEEARALTASESFSHHTCGKALMVHNTATRLVAEFYLRINKPIMPTRVFTDRNKAIRWLKEQLSNLP